MKFYTASEIAEILKVTKGTVSEWLREGRMGAVKIGGTKTIRVSEDDLNKFLADNRMVATTSKE
ncbi:MAG: helix-turn-helix domain-containing protein [Anaerotignum sp.]|nr:helix-turn-helix domain-containing protein [Anaerotignum sp.]